jgi:hypothetical protein
VTKCGEHFTTLIGAGRWAGPRLSLASVRSPGLPRLTVLEKGLIGTMSIVGIFVCSYFGYLSLAVLCTIIRVLSLIFKWSSKSLIGPYSLPRENSLECNADALDLPI